MMNQELRKFITSQYLSIGVRITASIIIPAVILYHFDLLGSMMAVPLGALCLSLCDNPGPPQHRKNGLMVSLLINFFVAVVIGYSKTIPWLVCIEIVVFGMFFTLISVYGNRAFTIGSIALLVFIFNLDPSHPQPVIQNALLFTAGGMVYMILSSILYQLRPYLLAQQQLGGCLINTSAFLRTKAFFYDKDHDYDTLTKNLLSHQVTIQQDHANLRDTLFKTRRIVSESTTKSRVLMLMFLDSIDLFERIMISETNYAALHKEFEGNEIIPSCQRLILLLSDQLQEIGIAIQSGVPSKSLADLDAEMQQTRELYEKIKQKDPEPTEGRLLIKRIVTTLQDLTERIKRLHLCTTYDKKISSQYKREVNLEQFISHQAFDPRIFIDNISLESGHFRNAIRLTVALLIGYLASLFYSLGHGYWILLTIATIIRPAYSITRQRNIHRLIGTFVGGTLGFLCIYFLASNSTILFFIMLIAMIVSYSFMQLSYWLSCAGITAYVLLSFYFLSPHGYVHVLSDRVIDTIIGSAIAFIIPMVLLPTWAKDTIWNNMLVAVKNNKKYFDTVVRTFIGDKADVTTYKLARKNAFVALGNLSQDLQRMLSEPKDKRTELRRYHQFTATCHMMTAHIAALAHYVQTHPGKQYNAEEMRLLIQHLDLQLRQIIEVMTHPEQAEMLDVNAKQPISEKIAQLNNKDVKTITDQFEVISTLTIDQIRLLKKLLSQK